MVKKEKSRSRIATYATFAVPGGILVGFTLSCMDTLLFCKTIAKYFFEMDTIFVSEVQLIGIYSAFFGVLALAVIFVLLMYDRTTNQVRSKEDIFIETFFTLYIISVLLVLYVSFHHCGWRSSKSFSAFLLKFRFVILLPLAFILVKKRISEFCRKKGLFSIFSFFSLCIFSTIAVLNYLLLWKIYYPDKLLTLSVVSVVIYLFVLFFITRIILFQEKGVILPLVLVACMNCYPIIHGFSMLQNDNLEKIVEAKTEEKLNVLLIVSDALRADALSIYGSTNPTPNIDALAREGVYFANAYSPAPWTLPSMVSLFTSYYPSVLDYGDLYFYIGRNHETLADFFNLKGYHCKALVGNFALNKELGIHQGFHEYMVFNNLSPGSKFLYGFPILGEFEYEVRKILGLRYFIDTTEILTDAMTEFFNKAKRHKFNWFLWVHYMDPHDPYSPPREYVSFDDDKAAKVSFDPYCLAPNDRRFGGLGTHELRRNVSVSRKEKDHIRMLYLAEVRYLDDMIGKAIRELKRLNLYDNTIIVFTSDHGEEFWDHGSFYHGHSLYDELLHVPLIFRVPNLPGGEAISDMTGLKDLKSLLEKAVNCGLENTKGPIFPLRFSEWRKGHYVFSEKPDRYDRSRVAVRNSEFKLIYSFDSGTKELFDTINDPWERRDISEVNTEVTEYMVDELRRWKKENNSLKRDLRKDALVDNRARQDALRRLKALGYIQ
jgi:arylsulfatase A-like enzyme